MKKFKWLMVLMSLSCQLHAFDAEHVLWDKTPIAIDLSLSEERLIHFPQALSIIDNEASDSITVLKAQGSLYLKGKKPFMNKRLFIQLMPQGEVVILNLSAKEKMKGMKPIEVLLENKKEEKASGKTSSFDINAITLTRFAIQSLYSPQRLLVIPENISRQPMQTRRQITLFFGANIEARPLISWQGGGLYVTAVELKNLLNKEVIVDPRLMVGNWQTATFYPSNTLSPKGKDDSSTVFLISDRPFATALAANREFVR